MHVIERSLMALSELRRVTLRIGSAAATSQLNGFIFWLNATFMTCLQDCILIGSRLLAEEINGRVLIIDAAH